MSITLKSATRDDYGRLIGTYDITHTGPQTTLALDLDLIVDTRFVTPPVSAVMEIKIPQVESPDDAFDKMAEWLERAALAIRSRKKGVGLSLPSE